MSDSLSHSIVLSSRFLRSVFEQVSSLVQTFERELQRKGWTATASTDIGAGLSNRLKSPSSWMPRLVSRVFSPGSGRQDRVGLVVVVLEADSIENALLVTAALRLRTPLTADEFFSAWRNSESFENVLPIVSDAPETWVDMPETARNDPALWSMPVIARIRAIDLTLVDNEQTLLHRVIEPLLEESNRHA